MSRKRVCSHGARSPAQLSGSPASSSCGSMNSNRHQLTPETDSSRDGSPSSMQPHTARLSALHIKENSPPCGSNECRKIPSSLKRPAADEPVVAKHRKRLESSSEDLAFHRGDRCNSPEGDCQPLSQHQRYASCPNSMARHSRQITKSASDIQTRKSGLLTADRHDSLMENNVRDLYTYVHCARLTGSRT